MSCPSVTTILNTEYIGNSLTTINNNFISLKNGLCDNQIQISQIQSTIQTLDNTLVQLSSYATQGIAKIRTKFSGLNDSNNTISFLIPDRYIFNSLGVSSVYRKSIGDYRVYFTSPLNSEHYTFSVNNKETLLSGKYFWAQVYNTQKEYLDIRVQSFDGILTDPEFVSLVIFV